MCVLPCLQVDPSECKVLLTDPALNPLANRQRMLGVMFETYGFESAFMQVGGQSIANLISSFKPRAV